MKYFLTFIFMFAFSTNALATIQRKSIEYNDHGTALEGYLVYDDDYEGPQPGIMIVHEWKGLGEYAKRRADMLADLGYVAFAIDMYGKGITAETHEEAAELSAVYREDRLLMRQRAMSGLSVLTSQPNVDSSNIAAIGYCFGGSAVLELARAGADIRGVVSFHGGLSTSMPALAGSVKAKVLALQGADDPFNGPVVVDAFEDEMKKSGADWQMIVFGNTVHSFTVFDAGSDKSSGIAYNEDSDMRSWQYLQDFLEEIFV